MKAKLLTISLMVGLFMGCHDFLDVKPVGKLIPTDISVPLKWDELNN